jgi:hypothetical protein
MSKGTTRQKSNRSSNAPADSKGSAKPKTVKLEAPPSVELPPETARAEDAIEMPPDQTAADALAPRDIPQEIPFEADGIDPGFVAVMFGGRTYVTTEQYLDLLTTNRTQSARLENLEAKVVELSEPPVPPEPEPSPLRELKPHLRCPTCYTGYGGKAARRKWKRQVSGTLQKRCYVCDQCGMEWIAEVRIEEDDDGITHVSTKVTEVREK